MANCGRRGAELRGSEWGAVGVSQPGVAGGQGWAGRRRVAVAEWRWCSTVPPWLKPGTFRARHNPGCMLNGRIDSERSLQMCTSQHLPPLPSAAATSRTTTASTVHRTTPAAQRPHRSHSSRRSHAPLDTNHSCCCNHVATRRHITARPRSAVGLRLTTPPAGRTPPERPLLRWKVRPQPY